MGQGYVKWGYRSEASGVITHNLLYKYRVASQKDDNESYDTHIRTRNNATGLKLKELLNLFYEKAN